MPTYMFQGRYTAESVASMVKTPQDRAAVVRSVTESLGGKMIGFWLAFGEYDYVGICELPDSQAAAAFALATCAGGSIHSTKTVELVPWPDAMKAMKTATSVKYQPAHQPGK